MSTTFSLNFLGPETEDALKSLARLTNSSIKIEETISVVVESDELAVIVKKLLRDPIIEPAQAVAPRIARKFESQPVESKNCAACGEPLEANAARNSKYCTRTECKHERWRQTAREQAKAKRQLKNQLAELETTNQPPDLTQILGEEAITLAPDPLAFQ